MRRHPILVFFLLATVLAWAVWVPAATASYGLPGFTLPAAGLLGTLGPGIAALLVAGCSEGRGGIGRLLGRLRIWRVAWAFYALALLARLPVALGAFLGYTLLTGAQLPWSGPAWTTIFVVTLIQVPNTLLEEIGWRGYAFPRLLGPHPSGSAALRLGLLFGLFHAVWHVPYWLTQTAAATFGWPVLALWGVIVVSMTVVMAAVFVRTRGSLLIAWLMHLAANVTTVYIPVSAATEASGSLLPQALESALFVLLAAVVASICLPHRGGECHVSSPYQAGPIRRQERSPGAGARAPDPVQWGGQAL